jgi:hypothetical protein
MATYSVTGTYSYRAGSWYDGSGQAPGATIEAETARDAAETYRETVVVPLLADKGGFKPVSNVCAVAIDGDAETYSDPLEGLATPSASRLAMLRSMRVADLRAFAAEPFRYGLGSQPAIRGRSKMRRRELADALHARGLAARADRENWALWSREVFSA